jgi:hypothetical protein
MAVNLHKRRRNKPSIDDCAKASLEAIFEANAPDMAFPFGGKFFCK